MTNTLNTLANNQIISALAMSVGRPVCRADRLEITDFGDCWRTDYWWADGACRYFLHDSKEEAIQDARENGFVL